MENRGLLFEGISAYDAPMRLCLLALFLPLGQTYAQDTRDPFGMIHHFERVTLDTEFFAEGVAFGDINGDGHTDVIAGPWWYQGPTFKQRHAFSPRSLSIQPATRTIFSHLSMTLTVMGIMTF